MKVSLGVYFQNLIILRKVMIVFVILENEKTIESFEKYDVLRLWLG